MEKPTNDPTPKNVPAEVSLIQAILAEPGVLDRIGAIVGPDFYEPINRAWFERLSHLYNEDRTLPLSDFLRLMPDEATTTRLGGMARWMEMLSGFAPSSSAPTYAKLIVECADKRRLFDLGSKLRNLVCDPDAGSSVDICNVANVEIQAIAQRKTGKIIPLGTYVAEVCADIHDCATGNPRRGLMTGYPMLDALLGGIEPDALVILAARPSVGKSAFAIDVSRRVALTGYPVLFFTLEMSGKSNAKRLLSVQSQVPAALLRTCDMKANMAERVRNAASQVMDLPLHLDETAGLPLNELRARAASHSTIYQQLKMIVVDYLQLVTTPHLRSLSREQQVAEISRSLKAVAKTLRVPVLALAQLSRASEQANRKPMLSDLRESGSIEQDADVVMFLSRVSDGPQDKHQTDEQILIDVAKNRNGALGSVLMNYHRPTLTFSEV